MSYFARNKAFRISFHKKSFSLMWNVVFKLGYLFVKEVRMPLLKTRSICKQATIKLLLADSFRKTLFIGQNLKNVWSYFD